MPAPYSDDLYSAEDADEDVLSPSDGYFHASSDDALSPASPSSAHAPAVPHVPNVIVEDPSLNPAGAKAREAEEERVHNEPPSSRSVPGPVPVHHRRSVEEEELVVSPVHSVAPRAEPFPRVQPPGDAPPAYSPSPTSPARGYHTFAPTPLTAAMGVPDESQRLLHREPESMGGRSDGPGLSIWRRTRESFTLSNSRRKLRTILGGLVILSIVVILSTTVTIRPHEDPDRITDPDSDKVKKPTQPLEPEGDLTWSPLHGCLDTPQPIEIITQGLSLSHDRVLTVIQSTQKDDGQNHYWPPKVWGEMIITPTESSSAGKLVMEVIGNSDALSVNIHFNKPEQRFEMLTPKWVDWPHTSGLPCLKIRVTVYVPMDTVVEGLHLDSVHLDIGINEGLKMYTKNGATLRTVAGDITAPTTEGDTLPYQLNARDIYIHTTSGDVKGWYPLYDTLSISTTSGDVGVDVGPKPALPKAVKPASLDVKTTSGEITLHEPIPLTSHSVREFPARDYTVQMGTSSGDVTADLAFSSKAKIETSSGDIKLRLWPVLDADNADVESHLFTQSQSGDVELDVLEPLWTSSASAVPESPIRSDPDDPEWTPIGDKDPYLILDPWAGPTASAAKHALSNLQSTHSTSSGAITLRYPSSWEGTLTAETASGSQRVRGEGLSVRKMGGYPRTVRGSKGEGDSVMSVRSTSGDQDVSVGRA